MLGWTLRIIRADRELTQGEIARQIGRPRSYVAALERNLQPRDVGEIAKIAAALSVEPTVLTAPALLIHADGRVEAVRS